MAKHNYWTWFTYKTKKYANFSKKEKMQLFYSVLAAAFVFSFNKWGTTSFDLERGLANLFIAFVFMGIFLVGQFIVKKITAVDLGYDCEYEYSLPGILVMLVVAFLSYGYVPLILPGHLKLIQNDRKRIGGFRFALKHLDYSKVHLAGYLFNYLIIILILGPLYFATKSFFVMDLIKINIAVIFFSMLPVPKNDGLMQFFSSRNLYITSYVFVIVFSVLILLFNVYSFIFAAILALILARILVIKFNN
jgi:Zn-dependent protease